MDSVFSMFFPFSARELARSKRACDFFDGKCDSPVLTAEEEALTDEEFEAYYAMTQDNDIVFSEIELSLDSELPKQKVSAQQVLGL